MNHRLVFAVPLLVLAFGCKKPQAPPAEAPPPVPAPAPAPAATAADAGTAAAPEPAPAKPLLDPPPLVPLARLEAPKLPPPPEDNLLLVIHAAETACREGASSCPERELLAAKIATDIPTVTELLKKGTDQQKKALRLALPWTRSDEADALLVSGLVGPDGALDLDVLAAVRARRTPLAHKPLADYLAKAVGDQAVLAIDALSALGDEKAVLTLSQSLRDEHLKPWYGAVCRGLSRVLAADQRENVVAVAAAAGATEDQVFGCRGAEAAFRTLESGGGLALNVDGRQLNTTAVLAWETRANPPSVRLELATDAAATCAAPGKIATALVAPLDRSGEPLVGVGLVARLWHDGRDLGEDGGYLFRFDELKLELGAKATGVVHVAEASRQHARVIVSGHFEATWCGVEKEQP